MGCSCLGPNIKIKSNIPVDNQPNYHKEELKKPEDKAKKIFKNLPKISGAKMKTDCSNISSSCLSFSDDDKEDDKKENENKN